mgnify:CR=1 FL=1
MVDTIFALSTVPGKSGIGIIRLSGPNAFLVLKQLSGSTPTLRKAVLRKLWYKEELLDESIIICSCKGKSFTGEDTVEFHLHGSQAVIRKMLSVLGTFESLRPAEAGEFTKQALYNGCLDLSQVEGLADLLNAETESQKKQALTLLSGTLGAKVGRWRKQILKVLSLSEIMIDFSEEDVPKDTKEQIKENIWQILRELKSEVNGYRASQILRTGFNVSIIGKPNTGKSSLMNYLIGSEKSIVSEIPGTTRDVIEASVDIKGTKVNFFDTAGIRASDDVVEKKGIEKALNLAKTADLRIFLLNPGDKLEDFSVKTNKNDLYFTAKSDIHRKQRYKGISSVTGDGIDYLIDRISYQLNNETSNASLILNERHKIAIAKTILLLESAKSYLKESSFDIEILVEDLRMAMRALDVLIGKVDVEEVLGDIFNSFCIGK